jgi:hypothetical protein
MTDIITTTSFPPLLPLHSTLQKKKIRRTEPAQISIGRTLLFF